MYFFKATLFLATVLATVYSGSALDKKVFVTEYGRNTEDCWSGGDANSCRTLDFALGALLDCTTATNNISTVIFVNYSHIFDNTTYARPENCSSISIDGITNPTISCSNGAGIAFSHAENISISGLRWVGCSLETPTTSQGGDLAPIQFISAYTSLFFYDVSNLIVENCYFSSDQGLGMALYDVQGEVRIINNVFSGNKIAEALQCTEMDIDDGTFNGSCSPQGGGMYVELTKCGGFKNCSSTELNGIVGSNYLIDGCDFENNDNPASFLTNADVIYVPGGGNWPFGIGGGLSIVIRGNSTQNDIHITNSRFTNNSAASYSGGINIDTASSAVGNVIRLSNLVISGNRAKYYSGGGIRVALISAGLGLQNDFIVVNVTIEENTAGNRGGGMIFILGRRDVFPFVPITDIEVSFNFSISVINSTFRGNLAPQAGAALMLLKVNLNFALVLTSVSFLNCLFFDNRIQFSPGPTAHTGQGSVFTLGVPLHFGGETIMSGNTASALVVAATEVNFAGNVLFKDNGALLGGGLYLTEVAYIVLQKGLNMTFDHNSAFEAGGAIYYVYPIAIGFNLSSQCFVTYEHRTPPPSEWDVTVTFIENRAVVGGSAIFVSDPPGCYWPNGELLFDLNRTRPFHFIDSQHSSSVLGTPVHNITFKQPFDQHYTEEIMPGQVLNIPINVRDYFGTPVVTSLDAKCINSTLAFQGRYYDDICAVGGGVIFNGPRVLTVNDSITGFSLGGDINTELLLFYKTFGVDPIIVTTRIIFSKCKYGFIYDDLSKSCKCYDDHSAVRCFNVGGMETPCIRSGYWFGTVNGTVGEVYADVDCPFDKCTPVCKAQCLSNLHGWCKLPPEEYELCKNDHGGPLCTLCRDGFSFNYNGLYCLPDDDCNPGITVLLIFLMALFWVVLVIALLVILRLNLRIGSGYVYCFVYYFTVLPHLTDNLIHNRDFITFISLFLSIAKLDPQFLSHCKLCFVKGITPVQMEIFHYFHPLVVALLIYLLILASRHCSRFSVLSRLSPVHAICILLLLSYASLLQTSLNLIAPLKFSHTNPVIKEVFVRIQPNTLYFHPSQHLPYALVAFVVEIGLVIPFAVIVTLAPWLMRWKKRMTRFKPILDEYQACYRDQYRWFAGYYLVCRHVVALTTFIFTDQAIATFFLQLVNAAILLIHAYFQPYRERWLNVLDTILLADLTILSLLKGFTAQTVFSSNHYDEFRSALRYILLLIPCLYFIFACVVVFTVKIAAWYKSKKTLQSGQLDEDTASINSSSSRNDYDTIADSTERNEDASIPIAKDEDHPLLESGELTVQITPCPATQGSSHSKRNSSVTSSQLSFVRRTSKTRPGSSSPKTLSFSRMPSFLNRVADGVSSGVQYWRSTAHHSTSNVENIGEEDSLALVERYE